MKLHHAMAPILILSLAGCASPRLPWQQSDTSPIAIEKAYNALMDNYVDSPNAVLLLQAAYQGTRQTLVDAGIQDSGLQPPAWTQGQAANWTRFAAAYDQIDAKYGKQVGTDKLEYAAINQMAGSLKDCQTRFLDPAGLAEQQGSAAGQQQFGGVGVLMKNIPGHPTVLRVLDGPARLAGLKQG
ncbi:MAG TPA: hypothetical protein VKU60_19735, partial [Chloroflexota bacterium]|nr:hypothetical protein [Chloroflexota bacterium]